MAVRKAESPLCAPWPCSTPAKIPRSACQISPQLSSRSASKDDLCRFPANHGPLPCDTRRRPGHYRPQRPMAGRQPDQKRAARQQGGWSYNAMPASGSLTPTARTANCPAGPVRGRPRCRKRPDQHYHPAAKPGNVYAAIGRTTSTRRRRLGIQKDHDRHRQHDLRGHLSTVIAGDVLHEPDAKVSGDQIDACYRASSEDQDRIDRGVDWLRRNFTVRGNPPLVAPMRADSGITIICMAWSCRTALRAAQDRRVRLVSRRGRTA